MFKTVRFLQAILKMNISELFAFRLGAVMQIVFMILNNAVFFSFWFIIYSNVDSISGFAIQHMAFLFACGAIAFGIAATVFGGFLRMSEIITSGKLDIYLTQPKSVLIQALASRSVMSGWGDIISGLVMVLIYFGGDLQTWVVLVIGSLSGAATILSVLTVWHSIVFWLPKGERLAEQITDFLITLMLYPNSIFSGPVRAMTYTLFPAAFITFLPAKAVQESNMLLLLLCPLAALTFALIARLVFSLGLRRYESGNQFVSVR